MDENPTSSKPDRETEIGSPNTPQGFIEGSGISLENVKVGYALEAASFDGKWYFGKIVSVDDSDGTFLVHFDGWNVRFDEWYKFSSKKVRPLPHSVELSRKKTSVFSPGENVLAKWVDDKFYRCHVVKTKPGDKYEVRFEDGVLTTVEMSKIRKANKIDEFSESIRLVKQQETIERARSRDLRLKRRSQLNQSETPTLPDASSSPRFVSELVKLEAGLTLSVSLPLSDLHLRSLELDEESPDLTVLQGKTFSVKSPSFVMAGGCPAADPESDTSPPSPSSTSTPVPSPTPAPDVIGSSTTRAVEETVSAPLTDPPDPHNLASVQLPQPLLPAPLPSYNASLPYTETVMTADGRVLTLTPSYQPPPAPAPNPAPPSDASQPLYYQLVPIQVTPPPNNPTNISIQPVDQSYLTIQQPYSYPIQTQYAPLVQPMPSSYGLPENIQQMPSNVSESLQQVASYAISENIQQVLPLSSSYAIPGDLQQIPSISLQTQTYQQSVAITSQSTLTQTQEIPAIQPSLSPLLTSSTADAVRRDSRSEFNAASDSESDSCDRTLFIDVSSAPEQARLDSTEHSSARESKSSVSEEEGDNRELKKLRLPDHNRKVAPRELVTMLDSDPHVCERPGCSKQFRRKESLKKHLRLYHGEGSQGSGQKNSKPKKKQPLSPLTHLEPDAVSLPPQFPSSADHSITQTELLFKDPTTPPPHTHRSKRKSSQPKKSSFHEPTTPTVTILVAPDLEATRAESQPSPAKTATSNPAPSRQSKRIRIRKNWDYESENVTKKKLDKGVKIKSTSISEKSSKRDKLVLSRKVIGTNFKTKLQQEFKEKAIVKIRPAKEQIIPATIEKEKIVEISIQSEKEYLSDNETQTPVTAVVPDTTIEVESDQEVQMVEEMEVVDSQINIVNLVETSIIEANTEIDAVIESTNPTDPVKEASEGSAEFVPVILQGREEDSADSYSSESEKDIDSSNPQEQIECVCGVKKDEGVMVQCEQCMTWQHTSCMGLSDKDLPDQHICHVCSDPPALVKREQYKHNDPWFKSGKLLYPTDADLVETGAQLSYLKNQLKSVQSLIPALNLKLNIAKNGNHPYLKEFKSNRYQVLSSEEISDKVAQLSKLQNSGSQMDISLTKYESIERESEEIATFESKDSFMVDGEATHSSEELPGPQENPESSDKPSMVEIEESNEDIDSVPKDQPFQESAHSLESPDVNIIAGEKLDPNLSSLMLALNGSEWGCQMRLFHSIEQFQHDLISQCSSIEDRLASLQFRMPDVAGIPLKDTLHQLESFLTNLN